MELPMETYGTTYGDLWIEVMILMIFGDPWIPMTEPSLSSTKAPRTCLAA